MLGCTIGQLGDGRRSCMQFAAGLLMRGKRKTRSRDIYRRHTRTILEEGTRWSSPKVGELNERMIGNR
ncbi:hypothetical protein L596_002358 [Steinernema carpocapsae]|uniref:Uncharacterized protein n=1 Tax=Steinernema carpocapsae TaxID=34508 RepID=A0A4U8UQ20_STECR|nr:hypothetical protein L596_002358 [Steinernema carpocapsae]